MSTTETHRPSDDFPTAVIPTVPTRRPILHATMSPSPSPRPFADWRDRTPTEELEAVTRGYAARAERAPSRRRTVAQHLRCAVAGTLLAIVAITGLSSYAAQGITDARSTALCQAHISCK